MHAAVDVNGVQGWHALGSPAPLCECVTRRKLAEAGVAEGGCAGVTRKINRSRVSEHFIANELDNAGWKGEGTLDVEVFIVLCVGLIAGKRVAGEDE